MEASIKAEHVSLEVPTFLQRDRSSSRWRSVFFGAMFDPPRRRVAPLLEDFNFTIRDGERVALLGQNGAGKSTLLKVLNGAYAPTSGRLIVNGRTQSLVNLSLGFNGQATVRENVLLRGTAMGLAPTYIRDHVDEILAFADIPEKINQRLYTLSSGQKMRLGFAISTSIQQDILLLDEWIGTGDANFKTKAIDRLQGRVTGSKIVVLASHRTGILREICNKGMVIDHGRLVYMGDIESAMDFYQSLLALQWATGSTRDIDFSKGQVCVYGCVDGVELKEPGRVRLKGWMASTDGQSPESLALRIGDSVHVAKRMRRFKRKDVANRFGVTDPECGFDADFRIPRVEDLSDLGGLEVIAGLPGTEPETPLRQSEQVRLAMRSGKEA